MAVSDRDRDYMRRLGEFQARGHADALAAHLARSPRERLEFSFALMYRYLNCCPRRVDDPSPFYQRARQLGLYRP